MWLKGSPNTVLLSPATYLTFRFLTCRVQGLAILIPVFLKNDTLSDTLFTSTGTHKIPTDDFNLSMFT